MSATIPHYLRHFQNIPLQYFMMKNKNILGLDLIEDSDEFLYNLIFKMKNIKVFNSGN